MKYTCSCGKVDTDSAQEFFTHVAEAGQGHSRITAVKPEAVAKQPKQRTQARVSVGDLFHNRWLMVGLFSFTFLLSVFVGNWWLHNPNMIVGGVVLILFFGSPPMIWRSWRSDGGTGRRNASTRVVDNTQSGESAGTRVGGVKNDAPLLTGTVNAFNIYVRKGNPARGESQIVPVLAKFEHMDEDKLLGQPRQLRNNKKWYHVHVIGPDGDTPRAFTMADAAFIDPGLMARYLDAPCQRSYIEFVRETLLKWVGPGLLAIIDGALLLVLLIKVSAH